jgi:hypothetical protein
MVGDDAGTPDSPSRPRRLRFSLLTMFIVVTLACLAFALLYRSHGAEAEAQFRAAARPSAIGEDGGKFDAREYEILQNTQISRIKSEHLVQAALRDPSVRSVALLADKEDPVAWLHERLLVDFPNNDEILSIRLRGSREDAPDLKLLVNAVAKAYEDEVRYSDALYRMADREVLTNIVRDLRAGVESRIRVLDELKEKLGEADAAVKTAQIELEFRTSQWRDAANKLQTFEALVHTPPRVQRLSAEAYVRQW